MIWKAKRKNDEEIKERERKRKKSVKFASNLNIIHCSLRMVYVSRHWIFAECESHSLQTRDEREDQNAIRWQSDDARMHESGLMNTSGANTRTLTHSTTTLSIWFVFIKYGLLYRICVYVWQTNIEFCATSMIWTLDIWRFSLLTDGKCSIKKGLTANL